MAGRYCEVCQRQVATERCYQVNHVGWALFSLFTIGIMLPFWMIDTLISGFSGQQCRFCGEKLKR